MPSFINKPISPTAEVTVSNFKTIFEHFTATANQTVFTLTNTYEIGKNRLNVIVGGAPQYSPSNYTETTNKSITLIEGVPVGTKVSVEITQIV